jgi:hypothetical protein
MEYIYNKEKDKCRLYENFWGIKEGDKSIKMS